MATRRQSKYETLTEEEEINVYNYRQSFKSRIVALHAAAYSLIKINDILFVSKKFGILTAYLTDGRRVTLEYKSINILYSLLNPSMFIKVNRVTIIHVDAISSFSALKNGKLEIILTDAGASRLLLSQGTAKQFRKWIKEL